MSNELNKQAQSMTISCPFIARALWLTAASFYATFCSGAWALLVGLAIQHSVLGADQPGPVAHQSSVDMTVTPGETVMTVTGPRYTARLALPQGALLSLRDQVAGQDICLNQSSDKLWVAHFVGRNGVTSGDYAAKEVRWSWDAAKQTLTIIYPASGDKLPAVREL